MNQIATALLPPPRAALSRMSLMRSPLKSPVPARLQPAGNAPTGTAPFIVPLAFISHAAMPLLVLLNQRMSQTPSPSKSPVPATVQSIGNEPTPTAEPSPPEPFMYQIATAVPPPRNRTSPIPSPLKSPVPTMFQAVVGLPSPLAAVMVAPFISHSAMLPSLARNRRSAIPSP